MEGVGVVVEGGPPSVVVEGSSLSSVSSSLFFNNPFIEYRDIFFSEIKTDFLSF